MGLALRIRRSLKTRIILATLAIFIVSIWALALYAGQMLRDDMQHLLEEQQFATVSYMAADINRQIESRLKSLEAVAGGIGRPTLEDKKAIQTLLEQRPILQNLFNGGVLALGPDGTAIANVPTSIERIGVSYMDVDSVNAALKNGIASVGRPKMGRTLRTPLFEMTVPIRDSQANVIGALVGVSNLALPNFLDGVSKMQFGAGGGYLLLVAPQHRLIITSSDKRRIMETVPPQGRIPQVDRFLSGYEGSVIYVNPLGVEVLASGKRIPASGWRVTISLPTSEVFAPIRAMYQRLLIATILLSLLAGAITWLVLRRQFAPLLTTVKALVALSNADKYNQLLPKTSNDEIGELIGGFNNLLEILRKREDTLEREKKKLEETLGRVKRLEGMIPICMQCKKIRTEDNDWLQLERYIGEHSDAVFSHGLCPECLQREIKKSD